MRLMALVCAAGLLLVACGGGGKTAAPESVLSASRTVVTTQSQAGNSPPQESVLLSVTNPPSEGFASGVSFSQNAITSAQIAPLSDSAANLLINFKPASSLPPGVYQDFIAVVACYDANCQRQFKGSPLTITVNYTVTGSGNGGGGNGGGQAVLRADQTYNNVTAAQGDTAPSLQLLASIDNPPSTGLTVSVQTSRNGLADAQAQTINPNNLQLGLQFKAPADLAIGTYNDETVLSVCYDTACQQHIQGSPLRFYSNYTVAEQESPPLPITSSTALGFNVVDAEYSTALESVVLVSTTPRNALYLVNAATGSMQSVNLAKAPTAVSVSPDGRSAAVGHDALISLVNLVPLAGTPLTAQTLNVSARTGDLVLDGNGFVHVFPLVDQHVNIHTVRTATNTETLNSGRTIFANTKGRLHPSGNTMYGASNDVSPSDIEKYSAPASGAVAYLYDSPYHGDYAMCGNLWFSEDGNTIYTACGNTFSSSSTQSQDMVYRGAMSLSSSQYYNKTIRSLSHSGETKQIGAIEQDTYCKSQSNAPDCRDQISFFESDFLNLTARYRMPPQTVNGTAQPQEPLFIFHSGNGATRYVIARLPQAAATETYLHRVPQ